MALCSYGLHSYATYLVADPRETLLDGALQLVLVLVDFKMVAL